MSGVVRMKAVVDDYSYEGSSAYTEATEIDMALGIAALTSLSFGGVTTADVFVFVADQVVTLTFNTNTNTLATIDAGKPVILTGTALTAVYVTTTVATNIKYRVYGA